MKKTILVVFLAISSTLYSQNLQRQMVTAQGNSFTIANGMYISQSIGQQSLTGTSQKNNLTISQGYQQSLWSNYIKTNDASIISTKTYPNPFFDTVYFQFSQLINTSIQITLFDITGKIVYQETKKPNEKILSIANLQLPSATYLVRLTADKLNYYTQIIQSK
ncbi:T9SS type A sorting domain-containing protein [Flavobacterium ammonificans]|uniref:Secretion system C-terminal sorting domain-containing protein n=1 Tax=Flavobacterium ammonificans TaxID=1751056 RepID=A0ABN6KTF3_9FLAO|nr:T9SS type A sorting domain-containing protein [Flavobacterium ammonificans]BDB52416.1 hypothetical protein GENT11_07280 [Flavobacterium ammonificans]